MKKKTIDENQKNEIITKYNNGYSIRKLEREYPYSFTFIQKLIHSHNWEKQINVNYPIKEHYNIIAVCKKTNKKFYDYSNESGIITTHIFDLYPEESKKSKYKRKSVEYSTGKFWYDQYFYFDYEIKKEEKKCFYCDWLTHDVNNTSGAYEKHLKLTHNKSVSDYLKDNPNDKKYFNNLEPENGVTCKICGKKYNHINYKHLKTHNISLHEYKLKYSTNTISKNLKLKQQKHYNNFLKNKPFTKQSSYEKEIINNLPNINFTISDRKILNGLEMDLYDPKNKIGIEVNGVFYHSEIGGKKDKNYHLNKSIQSLKRGINLIHIFEDEMVYKKDIVISKLKHIFNCSNAIKLHARKLIITELNNNVISDFLDKYHIQGSSKNSINIGTYYKEKLVAVMCFDNKRYFNKEKNHNNNTYELTRFVTHSDYIIRGIASKLLNYFIREYKPEKIISFADRRWTPDQHNNLYIKLGFELVKILKPDYSYVNGKISRKNRLHKFGFGKSSLKKRYPEIYDDNKTEWEMMQELGYDRIWDCGKFKYELKL
ncbi:MAG: hypothetical protein ACOCVF_00715 [bacterium]